MEDRQRDSDKLDPIAPGDLQEGEPGQPIPPADPVDPLKREDDLPGLDPVVAPIPED